MRQLFLVATAMVLAFMCGCTSGSSGSSAATSSGASQAISASASVASASASVASSRPEGAEAPDERPVFEIKIGDRVARAVFAETVSATALKELLEGGPVTLLLSDYGGFEKVGAIAMSMSSADEQITTEPGDIMLYQGRQISIFYDSNTWAYTRLGKIEGVTREELIVFLGEGDTEVTLALPGTQ